MPRVIFAPAAIRDLQRLREFLREKNPDAARRAAEAIRRAIAQLSDQPRIGRPVQDLSPDFRDLMINFGQSGYVARYTFAGDSIIVLALRHQREAGMDE